MIINKLLQKRWIYNTNFTQTQTDAIKTLKGKIEDQRFSFEKASCFLCQSKRTHSVANADMYDIPSVFSICKTCGSVYTSHRLTKESMIEIYGKEYRSIDRPNEDVESFFKLQQAKGEKIFNYINHTIPQIKLNGVVAEVGCGAGGILSVFYKNGLSIAGCDFNVKYLQYNKDIAPFLQQGDLSVLKNRNAPISLFIYEQVFEHIYDLEKELKMISELCTPDTYLYIGVPSFTNIHNHYLGNFKRFFQAFHLYHFTPNILSRFLASNGFEVVSINNNIQCLAKYTGIKEARKIGKLYFIKMFIYFGFLRLQFFLMKFLFSTIEILRKNLKKLK